jgi:hypothetical protein
MTIEARRPTPHSMGEHLPGSITILGIQRNCMRWAMLSASSMSQFGTGLACRINLCSRVNAAICTASQTAVPIIHAPIAKRGNRVHQSTDAVLPDRGGRPRGRDLRTAEFATPYSTGFELTGAFAVAGSRLVTRDCSTDTVEIDSATRCGSGKGTSNTGGVSSFNNTRTQSA